MYGVLRKGAKAVHYQKKTISSSQAETYFEVTGQILEFCHGLRRSKCWHLILILLHTLLLCLLFQHPSSLQTWRDDGDGDHGDLPGPSSTPKAWRPNVSKHLGSYFYSQDQSSHTANIQPGLQPFVSCGAWWRAKKSICNIEFTWIYNVMYFKYVDVFAWKQVLQVSKLTSCQSYWVWLSVGLIRFPIRFSEFLGAPFHQAFELRPSNTAVGIQAVGVLVQEGIIALGETEDQKIARQSLLQNLQNSIPKAVTFFGVHIDMVYFYIHRRYHEIPDELSNSWWLNSPGGVMIELRSIQQCLLLREVLALSQSGGDDGITRNDGRGY